MDKDLNKPVAEKNPEATPSENAAPAKRKPLKSNKWFWAAIVLAAIIIVGLAYFIISMLGPKSVDGNDTSLSEAKYFASPKDLIDKTRSDMRGTALEIVSYDGMTGRTIDDYGAYNVPSHRIDGRKFSNFPMTSFGAGYKSNPEQAKENYSKLEKFFDDNKFVFVPSDEKANSPIAWGDEEFTYVQYATYESQNLLCMIWHGDASATSIKSHVTSVGCGDKESYTKAAENFQQYYDAYTSGEDNPSDEIVFGAPRTGDSNTTGYKVAVVYQGDPKELEDPFEGMYYKKPGDNKWTYFFGTDKLFDCTDFDSDEAKKVFSGFECYDTTAGKISNVGTSKVAPKLK